MNDPPKPDQESTSGRDVAVASIRGLIETLTEAWNEGDGTAYAEPFTKNADYIVYDGSHLTGREAIAKRHQQLFDTLLDGSKLMSQIENIRFVSEDVAVVHAAGGVQLRWQTRLPAKRDSIQTFVAVNQGDTWRFTAFQNTRIQSQSWFQKRFLSLLQRVLG